VLYYFLDINTSFAFLLPHCIKIKLELSQNKNCSCFSSRLFYLGGKGKKELAAFIFEKQLFYSLKSSSVFFHWQKQHSSSFSFLFCKKVLSKNIWHMGHGWGRGIAKFHINFLKNTFVTWPVLKGKISYLNSLFWKFKNHTSEGNNVTKCHMLFHFIWIVTKPTNQSKRISTYLFFSSHESWMITKNPLWICDENLLKMANPLQQVIFIILQIKLCKLFRNLSHALLGFLE